MVVEDVEAAEAMEVVAAEAMEVVVEAETAVNKLQTDICRSTVSIMYNQFYRLLQLRRRRTYVSRLHQGTFWWRWIWWWRRWSRWWRRWRSWYVYNIPVF
jgi:hypothetical protein